MTLTTSIRLFDPVPIEDLWLECQRLVGAPGNRIRRPCLEPYDVRWIDAPYDYGNRLRRNETGQGLHALMWITYGVDKPLGFDPEDGGPIENVMAEVSFDTPYGYRAENDAGCGDLHAYFVACLTEWLDGRQKRHAWRYEYDGTWYRDRSQVERLGDSTKGKPFAE